MPHHLPNEKLDYLIEQRFSASLMSNHKWVKLLNTLVQHSADLNSCRVKLIREDTLRNFSISEDSQFRFDYWESAVEGMVSGKPTGWYAYKEFESIQIEFQTAGACLDFERNLRNVGVFDMDLDESTMRINAYSPNRTVIKR